jgi:choline dehydrogenase-like flavoprotein
VTIDDWQVIIGGGTAGLAVAARVAQGLPSSCVLVLEAGPDGRNEPGIYIPGRRGSTFGSKYDWNLTTVPLANANGRKIAMTRGHVLGGSSALNLMVWDRAAATEYDSWEELGNTGWNWNTMFSWMLKVENFTYSKEYGTKGVAQGGPIQALINPSYFPHTLAYFPVLNGHGIPNNKESLDGYPLGVMFQPYNYRKSNYTRSYSVEYIKFGGNNLIIKVGARVAKINFNSKKRAIGVTMIDGTIIKAKKEVILSAGSFLSPQLLELSGIGDPTIINAAGVNESIYSNPNVGTNLQDHFRIQSAYKLKPEYVNPDRLRYNQTYAAEQLALYNEQKPSVYSITGGGIAFTNWSQVSADLDDQLVALAKKTVNPNNVIDKVKMSYLTDPDRRKQVPQLELIYSDGYNGVKGYPAVNSSLYGSEFFSLLAGVMHGFSRGTVHINSSSVASPPLIDTAYLSHEYDREALKAIGKFTRQVATTPPMSDTWVSEYEPGPSVQTDEDWAEYCKAAVLTIYHPVGTCAMLPEKDGGVVDPELRVYGVKRLRVVDASIIPVLLSGHIQTAVYAIAEKAASIILDTWKE